MNLVLCLLMLAGLTDSSRRVRHCDMMEINTSQTPAMQTVVYWEWHDSHWRMLEWRVIGGHRPTRQGLIHVDSSHWLGVEIEWRSKVLIETRTKTPRIGVVCEI